VSEAAASCQVPSLLLMAPLENAVKHGVAQSSLPVILRVQAELHERLLELTVSDTAGQISRDSRPGGIGLTNTRERLIAMYGDAASMSLAREGDATVLRLRFPAEVVR